MRFAEALIVRGMPGGAVIGSAILICGIILRLTLPLSESRQNR